MRTFVPIISRSCSPSVKKFGEFEILPCLRTKKMTCQNSMGEGGRRHEIPGSERKSLLLAATAVPRVSGFVLVLRAPHHIE